MATYYLNSSTGSDGNDGLTSGTPWLTLAHALPRIRFSDTLSIADGSYLPPSADVNGYIVDYTGHTIREAGILDSDNAFSPQGILDSQANSFPNGILNDAAARYPCGLLDSGGNFHADGLLNAECQYSSIPTQQACEVGLLKSFALRWAESTEAIALIPFQRFVTGRIPNVSDYPFPFASVICGNPYNRGRSDRSEWYWRVVTLHVWVDAGRLEEDGERAMELARRIYNNESWQFNYGKVSDVLSGGFTTAEINIPEYHYWELVKTFNIRVEQARYDNCPDECPVCPSSESSIASGSACCP